MSEFKLGQLVAFLKSALQMPVSSLSKAINLEKVIICIAFIERRIKMMSEAIFDPN